MTTSTSQGSITIQNEASGRALDVENKKVVQEVSDKTKSSQRWQVIDASEGFSYIKHLHSSSDAGHDQVITATGPHGQPLTVGSPDGDASEWSMVVDGGVYFINRRYGEALSVYYDDNKSVVLWENDKGLNQRWRLAAAPSGALDTSHGKPFCISARSGLTLSVYLTTDWPGNDSVEDQVPQTWIDDPEVSKSTANAATLQWHITSNDDGTYAIRTNPLWRPLTFELDKNAVYPLIAGKYTKNDSQRWRLTPILSATGNTYTISSAENPQHYLTRENDIATDNHVFMRRMWDGGIPNPIISTWYITPVPLDIQKRYPATTAPPT